MSNHDDIAAAIQRLKGEADQLRHDQAHAMKEAIYLGTTRQQGERNDARRQHITDLDAMIAELHRELDPLISSMKPDERERLESLAKRIKEAPDQDTFEQLVFELNDFFTKRRKIG